MKDNVQELLQGNVNPQNEKNPFETNVSGIMEEEKAKSALFEAAQNGDKTLVENVLNMGVNVNAKDKDGLTALHHAVNSSSDTIVRLLLFRKASTLSAAGELAQTPLHLACAKPPGNPASTEIIKALVRVSGKDAKLMTDKNGDTPLFLAINSGNVIAVRELLTGQAENQVKVKQIREMVSERQENGDSVLHIAARKKEPEIAKLLIQWGAELDLKNNEGQTAMHISSYEGDDVMVKILHSMRAKVDTPDNDDRTPLYMAALRGHTVIVDYLVDKARADVQTRSKDGNTLLHLTCLGGHADAASAIMRKGVPLRMPNKQGSLCIHNAAKRGHVTVVKALLDKGVPIDIKNKNNHTPLHLAIINKKQLVVQLLLGYGADKEMGGGKDLESPIHMAARVNGGEKGADILIRSGADSDTRNENNGERAIHVAARNGNLAVVDLLLQENVEVARRSKNGETPLHQACANGHYEIAKRLIDKLFQDKSYSFSKLVVNIPNDKGETALHHVAQRVKKNDSVQESVQIVSLLLEHGANLTLETYVKKETPLHWVARSGNNFLLEAMLTCPAVPLHVIQSGINNKTDIGASPLMIAAHHGNLEVVKVLLKRNARVDVFDEIGSTALHHAASYGHEDVASVLLNHKAYVNGRTKIGITPLHISAENGYTDFVKILVTKYNAVVDVFTMDKRTPLHLAAAKGHADVCRVLLGLRADAGASNVKGMIPVHYAAMNDHDEVVHIFYEVRPDTMTQITDDGLTAMLLASKEGSIRVIRKLVGIDFAKCLSDKTVLCRPLLLAARNGHTEVVEFLLESGASATEEDVDGMSVILLASKFGQIKVLQMLWDKVAIDRPSTKSGLTAIHVAAMYGQIDVLQEIISKVPTAGTFVSSLPSDMDETTDHGLTTLHLAAQNGDPALIRILMNHPGVRFDAVTLGKNRTPLHYAALGGHIEVVSTLISKSTAPLHTRDSHGCTPLHMAAGNGYKELVTLLIGQGSDINAANEDGNTPIHLSAEAGYLTVTRVLTEYGASTVSKNKVGKMPISLAAAKRQLDVLDFLLSQSLNHDMLINDKQFLLDLVVCARRMDQKPLKNFVLTAPAPVHISSLLAHYFTNESSKNKEYPEAIKEASLVCQKMANNLITVSCSDDSEAVLNSLDAQNTAFLDFLIACDQKECVSHTIVQQYVTGIWYGDMHHWKDWQFILLFLVAFLFPPIWVYLCLPFKNRYQYIPIIKFICMLISHLYLITLLSFTTVVPWDHPAKLLLPHAYEWLLLLWVSGLLLSELTSNLERRGLGWIPALVVILSFIAIVTHISAFAVDVEKRSDIIFVRNQILAVAMMMCVLQLLQFLSIHNLFGPWGVIIGHLVVDVLRFLVIMLLFVIGFALQLAAVYKPLNRADKGYSITSVPLGLIHIIELLFFALFGLTSQKDLQPDDSYTVGAYNVAKTVFGVYNVLSMIVLVNLLIAMMSDTYQRIQERSDVEWKFGRAKLIRSMELQVSHPTPINLFTYVVKLVKIIYKVRCNCCRSNIVSMMRSEEEERMLKQRRRRAPRKSLTRPENGLLQFKLENEETTVETDYRIYSVVDWSQMVDKYLDITGEKRDDSSSKKTPKSMGGILNLGLVDDSQPNLQKTTASALQKISVINKLKA